MAFIRKLDGVEIVGKGCPYCGDDSHVVAVDGYAHDILVRCNGSKQEECMAAAPTVGGYLTEQSAIEAWNKRAGSA